MKTISIAIPVYEMNGNGVKFLDLSLQKICQQSYMPFEVVISDHSVNDDIKILCENFSNNINIKYVRFEHKRGSSSANLNNAIKNCSGDVIKVLMQDEFLYDSSSLQLISESFDTDINWLVSGCFFGEFPETIKGSMQPVYSNDIIHSKNSIGSPSVLSFRNSNPLLFNEDLIWIMDLEYYRRLYDNFGLPFVINTPLVFVCQHKDQISNTLDSNRKNLEENLLKSMF